MKILSFYVHQVCVCRKKAVPLRRFLSALTLTRMHEKKYRELDIEN